MRMTSIGYNTGVLVSNAHNWITVCAFLMAAERQDPDDLLNMHVVLHMVQATICCGRMDEWTDACKLVVISQLDGTGPTSAEPRESCGGQVKLGDEFFPPPRPLVSVSTSQW